MERRILSSLFFNFKRVFILTKFEKVLLKLKQRIKEDLKFEVIKWMRNNSLAL